MDALNILIFLIIVGVFGVLPSIWYLKRKEKKQASDNKKPSLLLIISTLLLFSLNLFLSSIIAKSSIGFILGQVLFFPLFIVGIFSLFKESRNWKSRVKVFYFTSWIVLFSLFGNLINHVKENPIPSNIEQKR